MTFKRLSPPLGGQKGAVVGESETTSGGLPNSHDDPRQTLGARWLEVADLRGKRPPHLKRWQIHPKRAGGNSLKSKQNKGIFIACLVVGFQAILRRKPITINIPLFPTE